MRIRFDTSFDAGAWPGPLVGDVQAVAGEVWAGPVGLLDILESMTGLGGESHTSTERAAALVPVLSDLPGSAFWSNSFAQDQLATAHRLLQMRDDLFMAGWDGTDCSALPDRLQEMALFANNINPGVPDRLRALLAALATIRPPIAEIVRLKPCDDLPLLWQQIFCELEKAGVALREETLGAVESKGNLKQARIAGFVPDGNDAALQVLRPYGALEAAEEVAAFLAAQDTLADSVVIGADVVLDNALRRYGVPVAGAPVDNGLLRILPLVLACGRNPADPQLVHELLMLDGGLIPRRVASALSKALRKWPAVGSPAWNPALEASLDAIEDEGRRASIRERLALLFAADCPAGAPYPVDKLTSRVELLLRWMQARHATADGAVKAHWNAAVVQCQSFRNLLEILKLAEVPMSQLQRLLQAAGREVPGVKGGEPEAGLAHVATPGAIAGAVKQIIWWRFSRDSAGVVDPLPFTSQEVSAMEGAGIKLVKPDAIAAARAMRWRRPLEQASDSLILVCPAVDLNGEEMSLHPLWDEIKGNIKEDVSDRELVRSALLMPPSAAAKTARPASTCPAPVRDWVINAERVQARPTESPSGGGSLVGCPFNWVLHYVATIREGMVEPLPRQNQLYGSLVHEILLREGILDAETPDVARDKALKCFDDKAPHLAAALYLPGKEAARNSVRNVIGQSAAKLCEMLKNEGARIVAMETESTAKGLSGEISGRPDLVIDAPPRIVDLKWGGRAWRTKSLENGTAYQLAAYGYTVSCDAETVLPGAYFFIDRQVLLATSAEAFPDASRVNGPTADATWKAFEKAYLSRLETIQSTNQVVASGVAQAGITNVKEGISPDGALVLEPPCKFCRYGGLCGTIYGETA